MKTKTNSYISSIKGSQLVKVSSKNSIQVIIQFIFGLFKIKLISLWLGASGMTIFAQFENFFQLSTNISSGGINDGITKLNSSQSIIYKKQITSTAFIITLVISLLISTFLFFTSDFWAEYLMHNIALAPIVKWSGVFIFLSSLLNIAKCSLKGQKRHREFISLNIFEVILAFSLISLGAYHGLNGALWSFMVAFGTIGTYTIVRFKFFRLPLTYSKDIAKRLSGFSLMFIIAAIIAPTLQIILRNIIINECSLIEAGWWDGVRRISRTYTSLVISTMGLYLLPRISEIKKNSELGSEIKDILKVILPFISFGCLILFLSRNLIIEILFSEEFKPMKNLFLFQSCADFMKIISWILATVLIMKEKIKSYIFSECFMFVFSISLNYVMISKWGIAVSTLTSFITTSVYVILLTILWKRNFKTD